MKLQDLIYEPNGVKRWLYAEPNLGEHFAGVRRRNLALSSLEVPLEDDGRALVVLLLGGANFGVCATVVLADTPDGQVCAVELGRFRLPAMRVQAAPGLGEFVRWVPELPDKLLLPVSDVPGFGADGRHRDGWFTRSVIARRQYTEPESAWAPGEAYALREGIYVDFGGGSYRLVPHRDFRFWSRYSSPSGGRLQRQGDLWVWRRDALSCLAKVVVFPEDPATELDRHVLLGPGTRASAAVRAQVCVEHIAVYPAAVAVAPFAVRHPEHGTLAIEEAGEYVMFVAPGSSRPWNGHGD